MRLKLLPLLLCLGLMPLPGHGEDLMDAYHQAIANDPVLSTADAARVVTAENVPQARAALLPQLSVGLGLEQIHGGSGSVTSSGGNIVSTGSSGYTRERDLSTTLNQPIINLSAIANLKAARASRDSGDETYRAALQNLYVRVCNAYFNVLGDSRHQIQAGFFSWAQDYPAPSDFIDPLLSCDSFLPGSPDNLNTAEFCDPQIDAQAEQAPTLGPAAANRWAAIDHELVDEAPWVSLYYPRNLAVLSSRTGNYQFHPYWGLLIDQLWVR